MKTKSLVLLMFLIFSLAELKKIIALWIGKIQIGKFVYGERKRCSISIILK